MAVHFVLRHSKSFCFFAGASRRFRGRWVTPPTHEVENTFRCAGLG